MADIYAPPRYFRRPIPISTADRALMDRFEAEFGITHVPRGVSGEDDEQTANRHNWTGHRFGQSAEFLHKQSQRRQLIRRLVEDRKNGREIAAVVGIKVESVYCALSRMRLKLRPRDG